MAIDKFTEKTIIDIITVIAIAMVTSINVVPSLEACGLLIFSGSGSEIYVLDLGG